jgi:hypothetical protein
LKADRDKKQEREHTFINNRNAIYLPDVANSEECCYIAFQEIFSRNTCSAFKRQILSPMNRHLSRKPVKLADQNKVK